MQSVFEKETRGLERKIRNNWLFWCLVSGMRTNGMKSEPQSTCACHVACVRLCVHERVIYSSDFASAFEGILKKRSINFKVLFSVRQWDKFYEQLI